MLTVKYAISAIWRTRSRYLLFGPMLILLFGGCFVDLTLGIAAGEVYEAIKDEFGR